MKKEDLIKLGLDEETAAKVEIASKEELKEYVAKSDYDTLIGEKGTLEEAIQTTKADHVKAINEMKIANAVDVALLKSVAKNNVAAKALLDLSKVTIEENGEIKGLSEQIEVLKTSEDTKFLFGTSTPSGVLEGVKPGEGSSKVIEITKEQFNKMGYKERTDLFENDKATYDALSEE